MLAIESDRSRGLSRGLILFVVAIGSLALGLTPALAAIDVFHSPTANGIPDANPGQNGEFILSSGTGLTLDLWIKKGDAPGVSACSSSGSGDVLCGYDVTLMALDGASFVGFSEQDSDKQKFSQTPGVLRIVGVNALSPTDGAQRLGQLVFDNPQSGSVEVKAVSTTSQENQAVGANMGDPVEAIDEQVIAAPEPSGFAQLMSGMVALAGLAAWRARCAG